METLNIVLVGVGGQGILLAAEVMSEVFRREGLDVKKSEIHGMAQRGGVVSSHVRVGKKVYSPIIEDGDADIMLSFEIMEALRWEYFLKPGGVLVSSNMQMVPPICNSGEVVYPADVENQLADQRPDSRVLDIVAALKQVGNPKVTNVIMLGVLSTMMEIPEQTWLDVIREAVPPKVVDVNIDAFATGRKLMD